ALVEFCADIADLIGRHEVFEFVAVEGVKAARRAQSIDRSPLSAVDLVIRVPVRGPTAFAAISLSCIESHVFGPLLIGCSVDLNLGRQPMSGLCPGCVAAVEAGSRVARGPSSLAGPERPRPGLGRRSRLRPQRSTTVLLPERNTRPSQCHFTALDRALHSASRPAATRSSGVKEWSTSTSCW